MLLPQQDGGILQHDSNRSGMRGEFVEVGTERLYYYAAGTRGQGDPILLLHGFPTSSHVWSNLISLLPAGHRVVVPDLLGFGRSEASDRADLSIRGHARRIVELLDELQVRRCAIVGHHLGACIATTVAAQTGSRVSHLGLLHPLGGDVVFTGTFAVLRAFLPAVRVFPYAVLRSRLRAELSRWFSDPLRARPTIEQYLSAWQKPRQWRQLLRHLAALGPAQVAEATRLLGTLTIPVAIATSDSDPAAPRVALEQVRAAAPSATLDIIPHVRHFSPEESPERIAGVIERLLRS
jgi:pimeloyl-ACP methyl ester carboxylesterase